MNTNTTTLIIEDNPGDALLLKEQLIHAGWPVGDSQHKVRLVDAILSLQSIRPTIVFLDLNLPDSNGLETFLSVNSVAPDIPIIILSGMNDTHLSVQAVKAGAQDYLVKGEFEEKILLKTILYGIERKRNQLKIEEANMRYKLASKATNDPLWDWDISSNEIYWNDKVKIFGCQDSVIKNRHWRTNNIHIEDKDRVQKELEVFFSSREETWSSEYRFMCGDGTYKYVFDRGFVLRDNNNKPYRMIGTMQDITEKIVRQRRIDEEKILQQQALLKANIDGQEMERDYISKELHDNVNQILSSANLYLGLAKQGNEIKSIEAVKTAGSYIMTAIAEIQKLARSLSASQIEDIGVIEAIEGIKDKINYLDFCKVRFVFSGDADTIPSGISLAIFRIAQEQLTNIVKHAKASEAIISLDIEENNIFLHISDNGIGVDLSTVKKAKGIGLSNITNRVYAHSGSIEIKTSPGNGFDMQIVFNYSPL
jgi:two-component system, NarL family, sensor histidine kinase UhpB